MLKVLLSMILVLALFSGKARSAEILNLDVVTGGINISGYLEILPDPDGKFSLSDIQSPGFRDKFVTNEFDSLRLDYLSKGYYWLRFTLNKSSRDELKWYLVIDDGLIPCAKLYLPDGSLQKQGIFYPSEKSGRFRNSVFVITPQGTRQYYIRINYYSFATLPVILYPQESFISHLADDNDLFCICYGILIAMILYNLFLFVGLRDKTYLAYIGYILGTLVFNVSYFGHLFTWVEMPTEDIMFSYLSWEWIGLSGSFLWGVLFIKLFLNTKKNVPKINGLLNIYLLLAVSIFVSGSAGYHHVADFISYFMGSTISIIAVIVGLVQLRRGYKPALYFLLAWIVSMTQIFLFSMRGFGLLPSNMFTQYGPLVGPSIESILLSIALASRVRIIELERNKSIIKELKTGQELGKTRNLLNNVINSMPSILLSIDDQGIINQWNEAASRITGMPAALAIGRKLYEALPVFERYREAVLEVSSTRTDKQFRREQIIISGEDNKRYYDIFIFPLSNDFPGVVFRLDDVTELEKKDQQLRQAQKMDMIGTMAGGLAHDFNNVLTGITGVISLLLTRLGRNQETKKEELVELLGIADLSGKRAIDMVKHLLTLSRKNEPVFQVVDLVDSIHNVMKLCERTIDKSVSMHFHHPGEPALVMADPTQVEQVFLNLMINAEHAMTIMRTDNKIGGELSIGMEKIHCDDNFRLTHNEALIDETYWRISVKDMGVGIDKKTAARIFDPFFTTKERDRGTGLGLSITYSILKQHNGFIDVYSEEGLGSIFNVYIPAVAGREKTSDSVIVDVHRGKGLVLVVDDEDAVRIVATKILQDFGYSVLEAKDGQEGIDIFRENKDTIAAVLLDIVMPVKSGREAYIEMKKIKPGVRVLLASGFKLDDRVEAIMNLGANKFIQKPYTTVKLVMAIHEVIEGKD